MKLFYLNSFLKLFEVNLVTKNCLFEWNVKNFCLILKVDSDFERIDPKSEVFQKQMLVEAFLTAFPRSNTSHVT